MGNEYNAVSHPSHYCEGRKYEPKDVIRDWGLNFNCGSAVKYLSRAGRKGDIIEDLEKAKQFIQFEIDYLKNERSEKTEFMKEYFSKPHAIPDETEERQPVEIKAYPLSADGHETYLCGRYGCERIK